MSKIKGGKLFAEVDFVSYEKSIPKVLELINARDVLFRQKKILLKPNLVNASPHPVTTPAVCCEAIIEYIRSFSNADIVIGEGTGDASLETGDVFEMLEYADLAERCGIDFVDLNHEPVIKIINGNCPIFPEMYLPEIAFERFIISVPVLKAHSLSELTGALKNMVGFAPPEYYSGGFGIWKKAMFHKDVHQAVIDLNNYRSPDLSVMDASVGLSDYHLGGPACDPPAGRIIAGFNPLDVDRHAAKLLGMKWQGIKHLAAGVLLKYSNY